MQAVRCGLLGHGGVHPRRRAPVPWVGHEQPSRRPRPHLRGPHLRVPDERPRLRAADRAAGGRGLRRGARRTSRPTSSSSTPARCGRTPTTSSTATSATSRPVKASAPGHADRGRRLPGAEGPRHDHRRRRRGSTSSSAPTTSARCRCCSSGPGCSEEAQVEILESLEVFPSTLPTRRESAYAAWVSISVGLQQHLHVLHRPGAARQGEGPPARRHPRRDRGAGRRGRHRGHPARPERQRLRRGVRRPAGVRQAAARLRRDRGAGAGAVHLARTRRSSPTT